MCIRDSDLHFAMVPILCGLIPLFFLRWRLNLLSVSEAEARSMGVNTRLLRLLVILCATLATAASVSISGMIGWPGVSFEHIFAFGITDTVNHFTCNALQIYIRLGLDVYKRQPSNTASNVSSSSFFNASEVALPNRMPDASTAAL